jgi:hypothetical protein
MSGDGIGVDLNYHVKLGGIITSDREDRCTYYNQATKKQYGYITIAAKSEINGSLRIDGKNIPVNGVGLNNYIWIDLVLSEITSNSFYYHFFAGDYTGILNAASAGKRHKYSHHSTFVLAKGSDVIMATHNASAYAEKFAIDPVSGGPYPVEETFTATDGNITVKGYLPKGVLIRNGKLMDIPEYPFTKDNPGFHFYQFSDIELFIKQGNEVERVKGQGVREFIWMEDLFPYK